VCGVVAGMPAVAVALGFVDNIEAFDGNYANCVFRYDCVYLLINPLIVTLKPQSNRPPCSNTVTDWYTGR